MDKSQIKEYHKKSWKEKRKKILERDNYACRHCGRTLKDGVKLDVHHIFYLKNTKAYDYPDGLLKTLCAACHLAEHGGMPQHGWTYEYPEDIGEFGAEQCEKCGRDFRHVHVLYHPDWGFLRVGETCAKILMNDISLIEQNQKEMLEKANKLKRFIDSPDWKHIKNLYLYKNKDITIKILENSPYNFVLEYFKYDIHEKEKGFKTLNEAKARAYELLHPDLSTKSRVVDDATFFELSGNPQKRISVLVDLFYNCIFKSKKIIRPIYPAQPKPIDAKEIICDNVHKNKLDQKFDYDIVVSVGNGKYKCYIKFIFDQDISQEEYLKIKECAVNYIKVDCTSLAKRTSTSLREIDNILYNTRTYPNYQWVSAPAFDDYFMKKNK